MQCHGQGAVRYESEMQLNLFGNVHENTRNRIYRQYFAMIIAYCYF